jgi:hypothetical protein
LGTAAAAAAAAAAAPAGVVAAVSALGPDGGGAVDGSSVGAVPEPVTVGGFDRRPKEKTRFTAWLIQAFGDGYGTRTATWSEKMFDCMTKRVLEMTRTLADVRSLQSKLNPA